jgi:hypothetical protein
VADALDDSVDAVVGAERELERAADPAEDAPSGRLPAQWATTRLFPTPGGPVTTTTPSASEAAASSRASSASRPTNEVAWSTGARIVTFCNL